MNMNMLCEAHLEEVKTETKASSESTTTTTESSADSKGSSSSSSSRARKSTTVEMATHISDLGVRLRRVGEQVGGKKRLC